MIGAGNEENVSQLLLRKISENTDAWGDGLSIMLTVLTILASIVTIISLFGLALELWKRKVSIERQELIIKDLVRHLFVNAAIMEALRMKMEGQWEKMKAKHQKPLPYIRLSARTGNRAYDDKLNLSEIYDFCILDRYDDIRVVPFKAALSGQKSFHC